MSSHRTVYSSFYYNLFLCILVINIQLHPLITMQALRK